MKLKLHVVPYWLERALKAYGEPVHTATDPDKLARIISRRDLDLYRNLQANLSIILPEPIVNSFSVDSTAIVMTEFWPSEFSKEEVIRNYLYGLSPETADFPTTPGYKVVQEGYDQVLLTVDPSVTNEREALNNLMNALLERLNGALPLEELATLPIFEYWLSRKP